MNNEMMLQSEDIQVNPDFLKWNSEAVLSVEFSKKLIINNDENAGLAVDTTKKIKELFNKVESLRKDKVSPFNDYVKRINSAFKQITDTLSESEKAIKIKLLTWEDEKERIRLAEQKKRDEEYRKQLEEQKKEDEVFGVETHIPVNVPLPVISSGTSSGEYAKTSMRETWAWRIIDINKVPADFLLLNEKEIRNFITLRVKDKINPSITGLELYKEKGLAIR